MKYQRINPEGWVDEISNITSLEQVEMAYHSGEILQGYVKQCDKDFNMIVSLGNGINGIIPKEEADSSCVYKNDITTSSICKSKVNKLIQFKVKEIKDDCIILSRKEAEKEVMNWVNNELKPGSIVNGIVKNIRNYGAFVEIGGGVTGLLHIEDISVSRIKSPEERFFVGQKIKVMIKSISEGRVVLTYKELLGTWEENAQNIQVGMTVKGIIKEPDQYKNGIFIELKPNLVGMAEYKENLKYGDEVDVYIKRIIPNKKKIKLVIK